MSSIQTGCLFAVKLATSGRWAVETASQSNLRESMPCNFEPLATALRVLRYECA
jgi:hypothetical protein